jgi:hypothetical protein
LVMEEMKRPARGGSFCCWCASRVSASEDGTLEAAVLVLIAVELDGTVVEGPALVAAVEQAGTAVGELAGTPAEG